VTRDDLEASLRRNLTQAGVPGQFHNQVIDSYLGLAADEEKCDRPRARTWWELTPKAEAYLAVWDGWQAQQALAALQAERREVLRVARTDIGGRQ